MIGPNLSAYGLKPERPIFNNEQRNYNGIIIDGVNLTKNPLATGAEMEDTFIYSYNRQEAERFSKPGISFELTVEDIFGRKITATHST